jgi:methyl-accepting chemotaxis protein
MTDVTQAAWDLPVTAASRSQRDAVYDQMSQLIGKEANRFDAQARGGMTVARDLAATLEADSQPERARTFATFQHFAQRHP